MSPNFCCAAVAVATALQQPLHRKTWKIIMKCLGMVTKSDQTVVENFYLYTNNLDIQTVGIYNIAHTIAL